jgi:hypothetical protein
MDVQVSFQKVRSMVSYGSGFWPLFWGVTGGGAALAVLLSLFAAEAPLPRRHRRRSAAVIELRPRRDETARPAAAAAQK